MKHREETDPDVGTGLRIREASELLGVPAATLRSWEHRYGLPVTSRSAGGHRRYTQAALTQLGLMRDEVASGQKASDAARRVRALLDEMSPARPRIDAVLAGSERRDATEIRAALEDSFADLGLAETLDQVVLPVMRQIGTWWASGRCDPGQEQLTTAAVRAWLARITTLAPSPEPDRQVLLATGPHDVHTLGLEALAAVLVNQGTSCRILPASTPVSVLTTEAAAASPSAVVIVSHLSSQRRSAVASLVAVAESGRPTFYGGNAFRSPLTRKRVPGSYLGERMVEAAAMIQGSVRTAFPAVEQTSSSPA